MAVTIVRTSWIDDDGTGTTGTVINNAVKTALYNDIDGALAKVPQLTGGNTFTGNQSILTGILYVNTGIGNSPYNAKLGVTADGAAVPAIGVVNSNPGNVMSYLVFMNSAQALVGTIAQTSATTVAYNTSSDARLKDDAGRATDLTALRAVEVHDFTWKADGIRDRGIFAQDAHGLYPRAVLPGTDETTERGDLAHPWMVDYSKFVSDLIVGWQQHDAAIGTQHDLLGRMLAIIDEHNARLQRLEFHVLQPAPTMRTIRQ